MNIIINVSNRSWAVQVFPIAGIYVYRLREALFSDFGNWCVGRGWREGSALKPTSSVFTFNLITMSWLLLRLFYSIPPSSMETVSFRWQTCAHFRATRKPLLTGSCQPTSLTPACTFTNPIAKKPLHHTYDTHSRPHFTRQNFLMFKKDKKKIYSNI